MCVSVCVSFVYGSTRVYLPVYVHPYVFGRVTDFHKQYVCSVIVMKRNRT